MIVETIHPLTSPHILLVVQHFYNSNTVPKIDWHLTGKNPVFRCFQYLGLWYLDLIIKLFIIFLQYLSQDREMSDHEEVELLLEGYRSDMQEIHLELRSMRAQIDDTR